MADHDDEPLEILNPTPAMMPVLESMCTALGRLAAPDAAAPKAWLWDEMPAADFAREAARFPLILDGWPGGSLAHLSGGASADETDLVHRLSAELGIMSGEDLDDRFKAAIEGAGLAADYRRMLAAPSFSDLVRNENTIGWGGFDPISRDPEIEKRMRRQRIFCDYFRGAASWTLLRSWDAASACALIVEAVAAGMISLEKAEPYLQRASTELAVRFMSWHEFSKALLIARTFSALKQSEAAAHDALARELDILMKLLAGPWAKFPWPRLKASDDTQQPAA